MQNLVLIGPTGCGKTTVAPALAAQLGLGWLDLDDLRERYYSEMKYSPDDAERAQSERGINGLLDYWKPFELHSVKRLIEDYPKDHVLAFGGGQSVYTDDDDLRTAAAALSTSRVVLLLPSDDLEESVPILLDRIRGAAPDLAESMMATVEMMVREQFLSTSNRQLADDVVYNAGQSVADTVHAILHPSDGAGVER